MCGPLPLLATGHTKAAAMSLVSPAAGLVMAATDKKKRRTAPTAAPVLAPTEALHNSSLFNTRLG